MSFSPDSIDKIPYISGICDMLAKLERTGKKFKARSFEKLLAPALLLLDNLTPLESGSNRPLDSNFEDQLKSLVYYHLEEHDSARHLLQALAEDDFAREHVASDVKRSTFCEAVNSRGLEQLSGLFEVLQSDARLRLPQCHSELGKLVAIDGSLIDSVLSMVWADYREGSKKAKVHMGFDVNRGIPKKFFLAEGKSEEGPFVSQILDRGETGILDCYYQCCKNFDGRTKRSISLAESRPTRKKPPCSNTPSNPTVTSFMMPRSCSGLRESTKPGSRSGWWAAKSIRFNTGSPPTDTS